MNDELHEMTESPVPATAAAEAPAKAGFPKVYLLFGVIGILVVALAVVTTILLMGGEKSADVASPTETHESAPAEEQQATTHEDEPTSSQEQHTEAPVEQPKEPDIPDFEPFEPVDIKEDSGVLGDIMANLEFLDYQPEMTSDPEDSGEGSGMSKEDSIEAAKWFDSETKRLEKKEKELDARQRELEILDKKVSQKVLRIEQTESARVAELAKLYDGMDPRSVAKLVANLDDETVVSILPRMKQKNASQVLALVPAARAAKLSKQMITIAEQ